MKYLFLILFIGINHLVNAQKMTPLEKAEDYYLEKRHQKSLKLLRKILQKKPNQYKAYLLMADNYFDLKDINKQEQAYKKALEVAPRQAEVYEGYGDFLRSQKRLEEAKKLYTQGIEQIPQNDRLYYHLGGVLYNLKEYSEALIAYKKAIALNATNSSYYFQRSYVFESLGQYPEALQDFDQSISLNPKALTYSARADLKLEMKDYEGALDDYRKAEKLDSVVYKNVVKEARDDIGRIYSDEAEKLEKTNPTKALDLAKQALQMLAPGTYLNLTKNFVKRLETKLAKQKAGDQFWAPYQKEYDRALELMQGKKYKEAYHVLDKVVDVRMKNDQYSMHPFIKQVVLDWKKCFKLKRLNLKKEDD